MKSKPAKKRSAPRRAGAPCPKENARECHASRAPGGPLSIVVVGASGDLALRKIYPALFALYGQGYLPDGFHVMGVARTEFTDASFRRHLSSSLACRFKPGASCGRLSDEFLGRCSYCQGAYDAPETYRELGRRLAAMEGGAADARRLYYLAIPSTVYPSVIRGLAAAGLSRPGGGWARVVLEKPFGRDRASSDEMIRVLDAVFRPDQVYRIDHYLGKQVVQNLMVLRFANLIFEPIWNRSHIAGVQITWKEDIGVGRRGGYFDEYGIIRDVMQNHLLMILGLVAMEPPVRNEPRLVSDELAKVFCSIPPPAMEDAALGQYDRSPAGPGYREEPLVAPGSLTPTCAAVALEIRNRRWAGVPFLIRAGKALDSCLTEVRVRFQDVPANVFCRDVKCLPANEMVIRVQPNAAITLRITNKVPGLDLALAQSDLDLTYSRTFNVAMPEAYESLLLDAIEGDQGLFVDADVLAAAWDVFTPLLHEMERRRPEPERYPFGGQWPDCVGLLARRHGVEWAETEDLGFVQDNTLTKGLAHAEKASGRKQH